MQEEQPVRFRAAHDVWAGYAQHLAAAADLVARMTTEEKLRLLSVPMALGPARPEGSLGSAAFTPGVPRLGIPAWDESDASLGVTNPAGTRGPGDVATAFPSGLALAATFDRDLAAQQGRALGAEARAKGFTVLLAGGTNLVREPRGGRIFEYLGEDVATTGLLGGAVVAAVQAEGVVCTLKHFALNPQETGRVMLSSDLAEARLRESDLLAFQLAVEHGGPRAIMAGYNLVNRVYASQSAFLLDEVLKGDWGYPGFVMSDWGGTHSTVHAARAGLDRQSGHQLDGKRFFGDALGAAVDRGQVTAERLDDMVVRILAAIRSVGGLDERRLPQPFPAGEHARVAARVAERSIVLLRNESGTLPLAATGGRVVVVGGHADLGVLSGGGSSTVTPPDAVQVEGFRIAQLPLPRVYHPPGPLHELRRALPDREVVFADGGVDEVLAALRADDVVVVVAERWATEGRDNPDLGLGEGQAELIAAVADAAARTVVVLETSGPVRMPWLDSVDAVLVAWYGGSGGARAIARVLAGAHCPSGRLPVTFPRDERDLPRPTLTDPATTTSNPGMPRQGSYGSVDYDVEGADVGYRWFLREGIEPLFWFGAGLSYTTFSHTDVDVSLDRDGHLVVAATVRNRGTRRGIDVPQVYVTPPGEVSRLAGWTTIELDPGEARRIVLVLDEARLFASYDPHDPAWTVRAGEYVVALARSAGEAVAARPVHLAERRLPP